MEEEIKNLKLEINVLKKRIASLEAIRRRENIIKIIKSILIIAALITIAIYVYNWYTQIMGVYNQTQDFLNDPLKFFK